uniref:Uncharacterized protein n=1 Tax=Mucochytrium quahogii TaxID=96639 RepID=A0A7S2W645_9STRA|mmetsp:Transcript_1529/g.2322  ORF Transcript_1529/g.2322 Transcript_1529/m.2322 type:complete len:198 (-) Transcript_1529:43-636(-)
MKLELLLFALLQVSGIATFPNTDNITSFSQATCEYMRSMHGDLQPNKSSTHLKTFMFARGNYNKSFGGNWDASAFDLPIGGCSDGNLMENEYAATNIVIGFNGQKLIVYYFARVRKENNITKEAYSVAQYNFYEGERATVAFNETLLDTEHFKLSNVGAYNKTTSAPTTAPTSESSSLVGSIFFQLFTVLAISNVVY